MPVCLVTGGAGFIGSHLAEALVRLGHEVRILDNFTTGSYGNLSRLTGRVELIPGDVVNAAVVREALDGVEIVFHLALPVIAGDASSPHRDAGTVQLLHGSRKAGVRRVVFASTFRVYDCLRAPETCSAYAAAKLAAEKVCADFGRDLGPETVCLRYFNVLGPRHLHDSPDWPGIEPILSALCSDHHPQIRGDGNEAIDVIHVDDVVHATLLAADAQLVAGHVYDIGRGIGVTLRDIIRIISELSGVELQPIHASNGPATSAPCLADLTRAETELGFCPSISLSQGLRRCIAEYTSNKLQLAITT